MTIRGHHLLLAIVLASTGAACTLGPNYTYSDDSDTVPKKKKKKVVVTDAASEDDGEDGEEEGTDGGSTPTGATLDGGARESGSGTGGGDGGGGGGGDGGGGGNNVFATGPAYASSPPTRQAHQGFGPTIQSTTNCMDCHGTGGNAPRFVMGGTVTRSGTPVADAEVRILAPGGTITKTDSDSRGYFWIAGAGGFPAGGVSARARPSGPSA
ncbi:MAG: hypothetical protein U0169_06195 [Polyangiaceae bacterium]